MNKVKIKTLLVILPILFLWIGKVQAQTLVNSLLELQPYLSQSNVNVKLAPNDYYVTAADVSNETIGQIWPGVEYLRDSYDILHFSGNNSTYDFTGVTIYIETETGQIYGGTEFYEVRLVGNNNTVKNLTVVDDGNIDDEPIFRANSACLDGTNNTLEGCHFTVKGSSPYGYGDMFGKGGNKRCAILVRGNSNTVRDCTIMHRAFGHGIYMQAANDAVIDGCHVEGELRTTDEVIAEDGTGSYADNQDFETTYGFNLRDDLVGNYYFSNQEDGIRVYNAGETIIDGVEYSRGTTNLTVVDCTVIKMRSGVNIGGGKGVQYVENCTALATESNFWVQSDAQVVNCRGDASVGAFYSEDVARSNSTIELTLVDNYVTPLNGETTAMYFAGSGHNITIHDGTTSFDDNIEIHIGEARLGYRFMWNSDNEPYDHDASDITFTNNTSYPIVVGDKATDIDITTCGTVADDGTGTSITYQNNCSNACGDFDAFNTIQAEDYCDQSGIQAENTSDLGGGQNIGYIDTGDWVKFSDVNFDNGAESVDVRVASQSSGGTIQFRLGNTNGNLVGTATVPVTGGWQTWQTVSTAISGASGTQDLFLVFSDGGVNVNWIEFTANSNPIGPNVALNGIAEQSSTDYNGAASRAIDGNTSGIWSEGSVTHTTPDTSNPWWEVDLEGTYEIDNIDIYNRTNCCSDRLSNFTVSVINGNTTTFSQTVSNYPDPSISINTDGATGDIVRIQINGTGTLSLAEVEVYGTAASSCATFSTIQAEDFDNMSGVVDEGTNIGYIQNGDWAMYSNIDLTCATNIDVRASSPSNGGGSIEVHTGSPTGALIGTIAVSVTGSWNTWVTSSTNLNSVLGVQDVYLVFTGGSSYLFNLDWIQFSTTSNSAKKANSKLLESKEESIVGINIYPNPTTDILHLSSESDFSFRIYNMFGKLLYQTNNPKKEYSFDMTSFSEGVYLLQSNQDGYMRTKKLVRK